MIIINLNYNQSEKKINMFINYMYIYLMLILFFSLNNKTEPKKFSLLIFCFHAIGPVLFVLLS
jgi:hypothetical protein